MPGTETGCCGNFRLFFWNSKKKLICKRTPPEWGQFFTYYLGFFFILMCLTACMCVIIIHYVQRYQTTWFYINLLQVTSSLSLFPSAKNQLIMYRLKDVELSSSKYISSISTFLKAYQNQDNELYQECTSTCLNSSTPCKFDVSSLGPCGKEPYGYDTESPCVLVKLNKHFGQFPCSPSNDPQKQSQKSNIEVKCKGSQPADREHYSNLSLYPHSGFPTSFYPFAAQKNYLSPLVAVQIEKPLSGVLITIECTSKYKGQEGASAIFQVMVGGR